MLGGPDLVHSEHPKACYYQHKVSNFKDNKSTTTKLICHRFSNINPDVPVGRKASTFTFLKWALGDCRRTEAKEIKTKIKQNRGVCL